MKKLITLILAALMVICAAGTASAYFDDFSVVMTVYADGENKEVGIDLLDLTAYAGAASLADISGLEVGTVDFSDFDGLTSFSGLYASVYSVSPYNGMIGLTTKVDAAALAASISATEQDAFMNSVNEVYGYYDGLGTTQKVIGSAANGDSFFGGTIMQGQISTGGLYGGLNADYQQSGVMDLSALDVDGGYVEMYLYGYGQYLDYLGYADADAGISLVVRINSDGTIVLNPSAVPVPGAGILLGAGLLALVGLRRKN